MDLSGSHMWGSHMVQGLNCRRFALGTAGLGAAVAPQTDTFGAAIARELGIDLTSGNIEAESGCQVYGVGAMAVLEKADAE